VHLQIQFNSNLLSKNYRIHIVAVIIFLFAPFNTTLIAKETTGYIKGLGSALREQPRISSNVLKKLSRGTEVVTKETKGIWQKIEAEGSQGWVMRGQISDVPVRAKKSILSQKISLKSSSGKRVRLRTFSAVVGVRGLVDKKGQKISPYQTDYLALEWMEKQPTDEENSVQFLAYTE
jgi:hypothetical protein